MEISNIKFSKSEEYYERWYFTWNGVEYTYVTYVSTGHSVASPQLAPLNASTQIYKRHNSGAAEYRNSRYTPVDRENPAQTFKKIIYQMMLS